MKHMHMSRATAGAVGLLLMAAAASGQPIAPEHRQPPKFDQPVQTPPPKDPQPAFDAVPPEVQAGARGLDARLSVFEVDDHSMRGGAMVYTILAKGQGVDAEMRVFKSGALMTHRLTEVLPEAGPAELVELGLTHYGQGARVIESRRKSIRVVEPTYWLQYALAGATSADGKEVKEVRKAAINGSVGARFDALKDGEQVPPGPGQRPAPSDEARSVSQSELAAMPEAVRAALNQRGAFDTYTSEEREIEGYTYWEVTGESDDQKVILRTTPGGVVLREETWSRDVGEVPGEFQPIIDQIAPGAQVLAKRGHTLRMYEYYLVIEKNGVKTLAMLRTSGKVEWARDNTKTPGL